MTTISPDIARKQVLFILDDARMRLPDSVASEFIRNAQLLIRKYWTDTPQAAPPHLGGDPLTPIRVEVINLGDKPRDYKLAHALLDAEREIAALKYRVAELERRLRTIPSCRIS
jgi:hypothetical protein